MQKLEDDSLMPFGHHKGRPMERVPVRYLHWFWHAQDAKWASPAQVEANRQVRDYIERNFAALQKEDTDLIWEK